MNEGEYAGGEQSEWLNLQLEELKELASAGESSGSADKQVEKKKCLT